MSFLPITREERERWHADPAIRALLNRAAARGVIEFRSTVESLRKLGR